MFLLLCWVVRELRCVRGSSSTVSYKTKRQAPERRMDHSSDKNPKSCGSSGYNCCSCCVPSFANTQVSTQKGDKEHFLFTFSCSDFCFARAVFVRLGLCLPPFVIVPLPAPLFHQFYSLFFFFCREKEEASLSSAVPFILDSWGFFFTYWRSAYIGFVWQQRRADFLAPPAAAPWSLVFFFFLELTVASTFGFIEHCVAPPVFILAFSWKGGKEQCYCQF